EPDALGAEAARVLGVGRGIGIGAYAHLPDLVGPFHQGREIARQLGLNGRHFAEHDLASRAVNGDDLAGFDELALRRDRLRGVIDAQIAGPGDAGAAHAARYHRGVARHAAARREDAARRMHAVNILGARLD